jgi:hypothetical protein
MRRTVLALAWLTLASTACNFPVFLPEFVVNTSGPGYSESEDVALGKYGDFIVAWSEFPTNDGEALARRFNRLCTPLDDPFPVNSGTTDDQRAASIARDAQGRFVAVWADEATTIRGRRFDADGTALGGDFPVNTSTPVHAVTPHVASDPSGNFVVTWTSYDATSADVLARRFDSNGVPLGDEFTVNVFTSGVQTAGGVAMSPAGFVVAWGGAGSGAPNGIFSRLFDADGNSVTSDLDVHDAPLVSANLRRPDVAMNRDGDFVVVWDDEGASGHVVIGRRWNFTGTPAAESFPISEATADDYDPRVASVPPATSWSRGPVPSTIPPRRMPPRQPPGRWASASRRGCSSSAAFRPAIPSRSTTPPEPTSTTALVRRWPTTDRSSSRGRAAPTTNSK